MNEQRSSSNRIGNRTLIRIKLLLKWMDTPLMGIHGTLAKYHFLWGQENTFSSSKLFAEDSAFFWVDLNTNPVLICFLCHIDFMYSLMLYLKYQQLCYWSALCKTNLLSVLQFMFNVCVLVKSSARNQYINYTHTFYLFLSAPAVSCCQV